MRSKGSETDDLKENTEINPRIVTIEIGLEGNGLPDCNETLILCLLNGVVVIEQKWIDGIVISSNDIEFNMNDPLVGQLMSDTPLVLILRPFSGKATKDFDPYGNSDNRAATNIDLLPLLLGETKIKTRVAFLDITTGNLTGCYAEVSINTNFGKDSRKPLLITMISATCLPRQLKDSTVYIAALALNDFHEPVPLSLGMSSGLQTNKYLTWGSISELGYAAQSAYTIPEDDSYVPPELDTCSKNKYCVLEYWYICRRLLVDYEKLSKRLETPFFVELAGTLKTGKTEIRGRYMGFVNANVILEPGEYGANISAKLYYFNEAGLPDNVRPLLNLPPLSAKPVNRETDQTMDEFNHMSFITIRFDVMEPIVPKIKKSLPFDLYQPDQTILPTADFQVPAPPIDTSIDIHKIRAQGSALGVHSELNNMTCAGALLMKQSIKKTAANRLLTQVKSMLKQFPPENFSTIDWQDLVSSQHSAARLAVTASFTPQSPGPLTPSLLDAARSQLAGDERIAKIIEEVSFGEAPKHPKTFLVRALRCLEEGKGTLAQEYLLKGLNVQPNNKYLLWMIGAQKVDSKSYDDAISIFYLAAKNPNDDGTSNAIVSAALHGIYHFINRPCSAFLAAKKMRKAFQLSNNWPTFIQKWVDKTGEEEYLWNPCVIDSRNVLLISSAFFLCLKSFTMSEILLSCVECGCDFRGTKFYRDTKHVADVYYLRAASFLMRKEIDKAVEVTEKGIFKCGPCSILSQILATSMMLANGWDKKTELLFNKSEVSGAGPSPFLLLRAALGGLNSNAKVSLQRAARAHKAAPSAHSALVLARVYLHLEKESLAERWAASAVNAEPNLADGWAFLACLALRNQHKDRAKALIRTAYQVGPVSEDIQKDLLNLMAILNVDFQEFMVRNICLCQN